MKSSTIRSMPLLALALFCIASCGSQDNKTNTDTTDSTTTATTSATTATPNATPSTIVTTPQNMMVVRHKVSNFNKWQLSYDAHDSVRMASGVHDYVVSRGMQDSNMVQVSLRVDDLNKAKAFAKNPSLKQAMQKGGVVGMPIISFTTMMFQDTANISSDLRVRSMFTVKDWDRWQHAFDSGRQVRKDNGLLDRAYGHDADDNHKVIVVLALIDSAKAFAFFKSDEMKKRQAASGMVGSPERFVYRVVKKY